MAEAFVKRGYKLFLEDDNHMMLIDLKQKISGKEAENALLKLKLQ
jgi:glycine/serine hydroxymethyltransferase